MKSRQFNSLPPVASLELPFYEVKRHLAINSLSVSFCQCCVTAQIRNLQVTEL